MNLIDVTNRFPTQQDYIKFLEDIRWGDEPVCPHCGSFDVARKTEKKHIDRWICHDCKSTFKVLQGTIFRRTQIPRQKSFVAIVMMMNAKKELSSHQVARDLNMNQKTAWYVLTRIRKKMSDNDNKVVLLRGIIEADETFIGGRPRRRADSEGNLPPPNKRDRGTKKAKILGAVQRGGRVVARVATDLSHITICNFIKAFVRIGGSNLMTDEYRGYRPLGLIMHHKFIKHAERKYVEGDILPKTIAVAVRSLDHSTQPTNTTSDICFHPPMLVRWVCSLGFWLGLRWELIWEVLESRSKIHV